MNVGRRTCRPLAVLALVALVPACAGDGAADKPRRHPTRGSLTYNGQPARGARVTLHPLPLEGNDWRTVRPMAQVEADGSFQLNSYDLKDGAVTGDYALTVIWTGESGGPGPDWFGGRFADPKKAVARVTIAEGENFIPPIHLKGPPLAAGAAARNTD
jgi:hypothetical protein